MVSEMSETVKVYRLTRHVTANEQWYVCPECGAMDADRARAHGLEHYVYTVQDGVSA